MQPIKPLLVPIGTQVGPFGTQVKIGTDRCPGKNLGPDRL
jgi:hypothetical protein